VPGLSETLLLHRAEYGYLPDGPVFATRNGTRNTQDNIRRHVLGPVLERANELLAKAGRPPIRRLTPHTLRRTFATHSIYKLPRKPSDAGRPTRSEGSEMPISSVFVRAAEGTRTLDLLHGKQTL
jgi:integrase